MGGGANKCGDPHLPNSRQKGGYGATAHTRMGRWRHKQLGKRKGDQDVHPSYQRPRIEAGQDCKFTVDGLPRTEYGSVSGKVRSIGSDAIIQNNGAFFRIVIEFDADAIEDSKGGMVNLVNGMTVRAWITYEKMTYLKY